MKKNLILSGVIAIASLLSHTAHAAAQGSETEAKAMLVKVVASLKADKTKALGDISTGADGFRDRDLYPFCGGPDGNFSAHPQLTGKNLKELKSKDGQLIGARMYETAKEGEIGSLEYDWPKPGSEVPAKKVSLVTKVGDQVCAVGYYKQ
jgi:signal transduction histidine kinase